MNEKLSFKKAVIDQFIQRKSAQLDQLKADQQEHLQSANTDDIDKQDLYESSKEEMMDEIPAESRAAGRAGRGATAAQDHRPAQSPSDRGIRLPGAHQCRLFPDCCRPGCLYLRREKVHWIIGSGSAVREDGGATPGSGVSLRRDRIRDFRHSVKCEV